MNHRLILYVLGIAMLIESAGILACGVAGVLLGDSGILFMIISSMVVFYLGGGLYLANRQASTTIGKREVYAIVIFGWLLLTLFGALPYLISRQAGTFTNAFFESLSGFTTTGASIFPFPEELPYSLLLWRGLSQWLGGAGHSYSVAGGIAYGGGRRAAAFCNGTQSALVRKVSSAYCGGI